MKKIQSLLHILSIGTIINSLHEDSSDTCPNSGRKSAQLSVEKIHFFDKNTNFLRQEIPDSTPRCGVKYDFIVVGAGTAGATIAARLSEIPHVKILLIENGNSENLNTCTPSIAPELQMNNVVNENYPVISNGTCWAMKNETCHSVTGKAVGGSSAINFMMATRGNSHDYDHWAEMGNEGWAYKDVLKYFKKLETMDIPELKSDTAYHSTDGPVHITHPPFRTPFVKAFLDGGKELKYPLVDYNGKSQIGFSHIQTTTMNGTRMSSNRAYLHPIRNRKNIHMTLQSMVTKVLIKPGTNRAVGVKFIKNGRNITVFAKKEVILCAGAIKSAQLLMLSGIGPAKDLTKFGIAVVKDRPVGKNFMDHTAYFALTWATNLTSLKSSNIMDPNKPYISEFIMNGTGPLTVPAGVEALAFVNPGNQGVPDTELVLVSQPMITSTVVQTYLNFDEPLVNELCKYESIDGFSIVVLSMKPIARGEIRLTGKDINDKPEIVPNHFDNPHDVKTMIAGIRTALRLGQTKAMQAFDSQLLNITYDRCKDKKYDSDDYWECMMRATCNTLFHFSGTCKMGAEGDPSAVVDPRLKVIGIEGLRVADASIMPEIPAAHTNIPTYMIGEKAADMIKEDHHLK